MVARPSNDVAALWLYRHLPQSLAYDLTRWKNVLVGMFFYRLLRRWPQRAKKRLVELASKALGPDFDVGKTLHASLQPLGSARLRVARWRSFRTDQIRPSLGGHRPDRPFSSNGIELASGEVLPADIIVAATGLKLNVLGDIKLTCDGAAFDTCQGPNLQGDDAFRFAQLCHDVWLHQCAPGP
jgi:cyclohexanone monooxygenase